MSLDSLWPWRGVAAAVVAAALWGLAWRGLRSPGLAGAAAGVGLVAGWLLILPLITASPRQLPERLPALAVAALAGGLLLDLAPRWLRALGVAALVAAAGWWMAGAPLTEADARRAAPVGLAVAAGVALAAWRMPGAGQGAAAALALAGGLWLAAMPGPAWLLGAALAAAALGAWMVGAGLGWGGRMPLATAVAGLAAVPVVARGRPADWAAAAAAGLALLAGPVLAGVLGRRLPGWVAAPLGWALAAAPGLIAAAWYAGWLRW